MNGERQRKKNAADPQTLRVIYADKMALEKSRSVITWWRMINMNQCHTWIIMIDVGLSQSTAQEIPLAEINTCM